MLEYLSGLNLAVPVNNERHPDASFREHSLLTIQGIVQRTVPARSTARRVELVDLQRRSIVADQEDQRLLLNLVLAQRLHDPTDPIVDRRDHGQCLTTSLRHLAGKPVEVLFGGVQWHQVDRHA